MHVVDQSIRSFVSVVGQVRELPAQDAIGRQHAITERGHRAAREGKESRGSEAHPDHPTAIFQVGDEARGRGTVHVDVPNVDEVVSSALAAGARLREDVTTFVSGDRFASIIDPFGVRWAIMTRVEDLSPEESNRRSPNGRHHRRASSTAVVSKSAGEPRCRRSTYVLSRQ